MNETIRKHMEELFAEAPRTRKAVDLKEEMIQNTMEKYQDLIGEGYTEEDACKIVLNSIGDVTELFQDLEEPDPLALPEAERKRKAAMKAAAAGLYVFAGVVFLTSTMLNDFYFFSKPEFGMFGIIFSVLLCIPPTCLWVYASQMYPSIRKREDTLVGAYREAAYARNKERAVRISVNAIIWLLTITLYFIISFATFYWHVTWIIFLVGGCGQAIAALVFSLRREA